MNAFQELIKKAAPIMAAVQSLFFYVITLSIIGYYADKKFKTFPVLFIIIHNKLNLASFFPFFKKIQKNFAATKKKAKFS